jgi:hypothetical protein
MSAVMDREAWERVMIVVSDKLGGFFIPVIDSGAPTPAATLSGDIASYSRADLFGDPQVCRRVGSIIARGAEQRGPRRDPTPGGDPCGSAD